MGRPPKPTPQLKLHGGYRKDRHKHRDAEPQFDGAPEKPSTLKGEASDCWDRIVPHLISSGVAKSIDEATLQGMCEWWATYRRAMDALDKMRVAPPDQDQEVDLKSARQLQMIASRAWQYFTAAAAKFGLTPVDRVRLSLGGDKKQSALEAFLRGGNASG